MFWPCSKTLAVLPRVLILRANEPEVLFLTKYVLSFEGIIIEVSAVSVPSKDSAALRD
jgi:hypothetical protein